MRQLPEPEAVIIAIVDDDASVRRELQRLIGSVSWKPETLSIFSVMPGKSVRFVLQAATPFVHFATTFPAGTATPKPLLRKREPEAL